MRGGSGSRLWLSGLGASFKAGGQKVGSKVKEEGMHPLSPEVVLSPTWPLLFTNCGWQALDTLAQMSL